MTAMAAHHESTAPNEKTSAKLLLKRLEDLLHLHASRSLDQNPVARFRAMCERCGRLSLVARLHEPLAFHARLGRTDADLLTERAHTDDPVEAERLCEFPDLSMQCHRLLTQLEH